MVTDGPRADVGLELGSVSADVHRLERHRDRSLDVVARSDVVSDLVSVDHGVLDAADGAGRQADRPARHPEVAVGGVELRLAGSENADAGEQSRRDDGQRDADRGERGATVVVGQLRPGHADHRPEATQATHRPSTSAGRAR